MLRIIEGPYGVDDFLAALENRSGAGGGFEVERTVRTIINDVKEKGDEAVKSYTARLDCDTPKYYRIPQSEIDRVYKS